MRHGTTSLFAALDVASGFVIGECAGSGRRVWTSGDRRSRAEGLETRTLRHPQTPRQACPRHYMPPRRPARDNRRARRGATRKQPGAAQPSGGEANAHEERKEKGKGKGERRKKRKGLVPLQRFSDTRLRHRSARAQDYFGQCVSAASLRDRGDTPGYDLSTKVVVAVAKMNAG